MPSTTLKICNLKKDYPQFKFEQSDNFFWSSAENTIFYCEEIDNRLVLLLHELSHALLGHDDYLYDIELITKERQAWDYAKTLAKKYQINIDNQIIQSNLDSYRDWIHQRSTCPKCRAIGVQSEKCTYKCPVCKQSWQVNEARNCKLRRYIKD